MPNYGLFFTELGRTTQLFSFGVFVYVFFQIWKKTYCISKGHDLFGKLTALMLCICWLLMAFGPDRVTLLRSLIYGSLSVYGGYIMYYMDKYPIPKEFLRNTRQATEPTKPTYVPKRALFRYLAKPGPDERPFVFSSLFRNVSFVIALGCALSYGFSRTVNAYTWGFLTSAKVSKATKEEMKRIADSTAAVNKKMLDKAVDTLVKGQQKSADKAELAVTTAKGVAAEVRKDGKKRDRASDIRYKNLNANINRARDAALFQQPQTLKPSVGSFGLPTTVQPVSSQPEPKAAEPKPGRRQKPPKGKGFSYQDEPAGGSYTGSTNSVLAKVLPEN